LRRQDILAHRAVVVADSSRNLPPRTTGLLSGQSTLTVGDAAAKLQAQVMGLGVGYLPSCLATAAAARGDLVIRRTEEPKVSQMLFLAWRTTHKGKALKWFVDQINVPGWLEQALRTGSV
jgi:DNA-binding transcriptional LysR family regulator